MLISLRQSCLEQYKCQPGVQCLNWTVILLLDSMDKQTQERLQPSAQECGCGQSVPFDLKDQRVLFRSTETEVQRNTPNCDKCFFKDIFSKTKGSTMTEAVPARRA